MAKLSKSDRDRLSGKEFAGPHRSFPINDKDHAEKAIQLAPRSYHAGNISKSQESAIVRKARAALHARLGVLPRKHSGRGR